MINARKYSELRSGRGMGVERAEEHEKGRECKRGADQALVAVSLLSWEFFLESDWFWTTRGVLGM